MILLSFSKILG